MATANQQLSLGSGHQDRVWLQQCRLGSPMKPNPHRALGCLGILPSCNPGEVGWGLEKEESAACLAEASTLPVFRSDSYRALTKACSDTHPSTHPWNPRKAFVSDFLPETTLPS